MSALVDKADEILVVENGNFPPELARRWHKALAVISRGPPDLGSYISEECFPVGDQSPSHEAYCGKRVLLSLLRPVLIIQLLGSNADSETCVDQGYYYFGLLDCVSQLAAVSDLQMLGEGLLNRVRDLLFDSVVPEFRWKAVSIPPFRGGA